MRNKRHRLVIAAITLLVGALVVQLTSLVLAPKAAVASARSGGANISSSLRNATGETLLRDLHEIGREGRPCGDLCDSDFTWAPAPPNAIAGIGRYDTWYADADEYLFAKYEKVFYSIGSTGYQLVLVSYNAGPVGDSYASCEIQDASGTPLFVDGAARLTAPKPPYVCTATQTGAWTDYHTIFTLTSSAPTNHTVSATELAPALPMYCKDSTTWRCSYVPTSDQVSVHTDPIYSRIVNCHPKGSSAGTISESLTLSSSFTESSSFDSVTSVQLGAIFSMTVQGHYGHSWNITHSASFTQGVTVEPGRWGQLILSYPVHTTSGAFQFSIGNDTWMVPNATYAFPEEEKAKITTQGGDAGAADCPGSAARLDVTTLPAQPVAGQEVTYKVAIAPDGPAEANAPAPTGTVTFTGSNGKQICTVQTVSAGSAACTATLPHTGAEQSVLAKYSGDKSWSPAWYAQNVQDRASDFGTATVHYLNYQTDAEGQDIVNQKCRDGGEGCDVRLNSIATGYTPFEDIGVPASGCVQGVTATYNRQFSRGTSEANTAGMWVTAKFQFGDNSISQEFDYDNTTTNGSTSTHTMAFTAGYGYTGTMQQARVLNSRVGSVIYKSGNSVYVVDNVTVSELAHPTWILQADNPVASNPNMIVRLKSDKAGPGSPCPGNNTNGSMWTSNNTIDAGQPADYTIGLTSDPGVPLPSGGTVTFTAAGKVLCADVPLTIETYSRKATCTATPAASGAVVVTAAYSGILGPEGTSSYLPVTTSLTQTVIRSTTTTTITQLPIIQGQTSELEAKVASHGSSPGSPGAAPTGAVTFRDENGTVVCTVLRTTNGVAACFFTASAGDHQYTASYEGDALTSPSVSDGYSTRSLLPTTTTVSGPVVATVGVPVTYKATVSDGQPSAPGTIGPAIGGTVTISDDFQKVCQDVPVVNGTASCTVTFQPGAANGSHVVVAIYSGDKDNASSHVGLSVTTLAATPIQLTVDAPNQAISFFPTISTPRTYTASLQSDHLTTKDTVTFAEGDTVLCAKVAVDVANRRAVCPAVLWKTAGVHVVTASFSGDESNGQSSASLSDAISLVPSATAVWTQSGTIVAGNRATLNASVSAGNPLRSEPLSGTVTFTEGATQLCSATFPAIASPAAVSCNVTVANYGAHTVTATYAGDAGHDQSSASFTFYTRQPTIMALSQAVASPTANSGQTFTITSSTMNDPVGMVTVRDGTKVLCQGIQPLLIFKFLSMVTYQARCDVSTQTVGTHQITAEYTGDTTYAPATVSLQEAVTKTTSTITLNSPPMPQTIDAATTINATVVAPGLKPTGTVIFTEGSMTLCNVPVSGDGSGATSCQYLFPTGGSHTVTANYSGDGTISASSGKITVNFVKLVQATVWDRVAPTADCGTGLISWKLLNISGSANAIYTPRRTLDGVPADGIALPAKMSTIGTTKAAPGETQSLVVNTVWPGYFNGDTAPISATMPRTCSANIVGGNTDRRWYAYVGGHAAFTGLVPGRSYGGYFVLSSETAVCDKKYVSGTVDASGNLEFLSAGMPACGGAGARDTLQLTDVTDLQAVPDVGSSHIAMPSGMPSMTFRLIQ